MINRLRDLGLLVNLLLVVYGGYEYFVLESGWTGGVGAAFGVFNMLLIAAFVRASRKKEDES